MDKSHFQMMAGYGTWANKRLIAAARSLSSEAYFLDRGAFFGSIHGTLNHILVADRVWLGRITAIDSGLTDLGAQLYDTLDGLAAARESEDARICQVIDDMDEGILGRNLVYTPITDPAKTETG